MTVYGVITAAIVRKVRVLIAEIRALVADATRVEKEVVDTAKAEAAAILKEAETEVASLKNDLVDKISKL